MGKNLYAPPPQGLWANANKISSHAIQNNPYGLLLAEWDGEGPVKLSRPVGCAKLETRLKILEYFCKAAALALYQKHRKSIKFAVQVHDEKPKWPCFRSDCSITDNPTLSSGPLIPDPYVLGSWGFTSIR